MKRLTASLITFLFFAQAWAGPKAPAADHQTVTQEQPAAYASKTDLGADTSYYNKWHTRFSYLTLALAAGSIATHEEKKEATESHKVLGMATAISYFTASYFAWKMPEVKDAPKTRSQKIHKILSYVTIPLMIALPLSGIDASDDYKNGHAADGIGEMKGTLTGLTLASLVATAAVAHFEF